ncbi:MAG TPA: hypothetical protein VEQ85_11940 [Lacipirellulaceae bacterium]|nr:hypothetical protein [Lacipirellulaceae bacterium]
MTPVPPNRIGATRGKLALVAILAVVLAYVVASNFRGSAEEPFVAPEAAAPSENIASLPGGEPRRAPASNIQSPFGEFAVDRPWKTPPLDQLAGFDPLALPSWKAAPAEAAEENPAAPSLDDIQQADSAIIFVTGNERVARIGDQDYHVGDHVGRLEVKDISSAGIVLSEPVGDANDP